MEEERIEWLNSFYYETVLPELFNYQIEIYDSSLIESEEMVTELEVFIIERIKIWQKALK